MTDVEVKKALADAKAIVIIGLSDNPVRPSHRIGKYLQNEGGYRVIPVNPNVDKVLGEKSYPSLLDIPEDIKVDIVNVFRRSEHLLDIAKEMVERDCQFLWAQLGVYSKEAEDILLEAEKQFIMNECIFLEHRSFFH